MTFDEAIEELRLAIPEKFYSPTMHDISVMLEAQNKVINLLREEYAPTVEMTKEQRKGLLFDGKGRETPHKNFVFMKEVQKVNEKNINIDILMSAFVHPETIKIVEE